MADNSIRTEFLITLIPKNIKLNKSTIYSHIDIDVSNLELISINDYFFNSEFILFSVTLSNISVANIHSIHMYAYV